MASTGWPDSEDDEARSIASERKGSREEVAVNLTSLEPPEALYQFAQDDAGDIEALTFTGDPIRPVRYLAAETQSDTPRVKVPLNNILHCKRMQRWNLDRVLQQNSSTAPGSSKSETDFDELFEGMLTEAGYVPHASRSRSSRSNGASVAADSARQQTNAPSSSSSLFTSSASHASSSHAPSRSPPPMGSLPPSSYRPSTVVYQNKLFSSGNMSDSDSSDDEDGETRSSSWGEGQQDEEGAESSYESKASQQNNNSNNVAAGTAAGVRRDGSAYEACTPSFVFDGEFEGGNVEKVVRVFGRPDPPSMWPYAPSAVPSSSSSGSKHGQLNSPVRSRSNSASPSISFGPGRNNHSPAPGHGITIHQEYDVTLRKDIYTVGNMQWFHFNVSTNEASAEACRNCEPIQEEHKKAAAAQGHGSPKGVGGMKGIFSTGKIGSNSVAAASEPGSKGAEVITFPFTVRFNIVNFLKKDSLYNYGMRIATYSHREASKNANSNTTSSSASSSSSPSMLPSPTKPKDGVNVEANGLGEGGSKKMHGSDIGRGWYHSGEHICYYKNGRSIKSKDSSKSGDNNRRSLYTLTFTYTFYEHDSVHFAYCFPYTYTDLQKYLAELEMDERIKNILRRQKLCNTLAGNRCDLLTVCEPVTLAEQAENRLHNRPPRPAIVVTARVHPGETNASYAAQGFINFITDPDDRQAYLLRKQFVFKIIPMLNPDGVIHGNNRCSLAGTDLNRRYLDANASFHPTIHSLKILLDSLQGNRGVFLYLDLHGHSRKKNSFVYGCDIALQSAKYAAIAQRLGSEEYDSKRIFSRVFPRLLCNMSDANHTTDANAAAEKEWNARNSVDSSGEGYFSWKDCCFMVQKSKGGTGRVVGWRKFLIDTAYTIELSYCSNGNNKESSLLKQYVNMVTRYCRGGASEDPSYARSTTNSANAATGVTDADGNSSNRTSVVSKSNSCNNDIVEEMKELLEAYYSDSSYHYTVDDYLNVGRHIGVAMRNFANLTEENVKSVPPTNRGFDAIYAKSSPSPSPRVSNSCPVSSRTAPSSSADGEQVPVTQDEDAPVSAFRRGHQVYDESSTYSGSGGYNSFASAANRTKEKNNSRKSSVKLSKDSSQSLSSMQLCADNSADEMQLSTECNSQDEDGSGSVFGTGEMSSRDDEGDSQSKRSKSRESRGSINSKNGEGANSGGGIAFEADVENDAEAVEEGGGEVPKKSKSKKKTKKPKKSEASNTATVKAKPRRSKMGKSRSKIDGDGSDDDVETSQVDLVGSRMLDAPIMKSVVYTTDAFIFAASKHRRSSDAAGAPTYSSRRGETAFSVSATESEEIFAALPFLSTRMQAEWKIRQGLQIGTDNGTADVADQEDIGDGGGSDSDPSVDNLPLQKVLRRTSRSLKNNSNNRFSNAMKYVLSTLKKKKPKNEDKNAKSKEAAKPAAPPVPAPEARPVSRSNSPYTSRTSNLYRNSQAQQSSLYKRVQNYRLDTSAEVEYKPPITLSVKNLLLDGDTNGHEEIPLPSLGSGCTATPGYLISSPITTSARRALAVAAAASTGGLGVLSGSLSAADITGMGAHLSNFRPTSAQSAASRDANVLASGVTFPGGTYGAQHPQSNYPSMRMTSNNRYVQTKDPMPVGATGLDGMGSGNATSLPPAYTISRRNHGNGGTSAFNPSQYPSANVNTSGTYQEQQSMRRSSASLAGGSAAAAFNDATSRQPAAAAGGVATGRSGQPRNPVGNIKFSSVYAGAGGRGTPEDCSPRPSTSADRRQQKLNAQLAMHLNEQQHILESLDTSSSPGGGAGSSAHGSPKGTTRRRSSSKSSSSSNPGGLNAVESGNGGTFGHQIQFSGQQTSQAQMAANEINSIAAQLYGLQVNEAGEPPPAQGDVAYSPSAGRSDMEGNSSRLQRKKKPSSRKYLV